MEAEKKPIVLFVSRLVWEKDLRVLANAYQFLRSRRKDFEMVVVGDGHAREEFQQIMPEAHFLGFQTRQALSEAFASSDIFVFPSTTETFGLVTLEAMASGTVPVAAKAGGAVDIIEEGKSGFFSEPLNSMDLAKKVEVLLDLPEKRKFLSEAAVKRAQLFSWENIFEQLFFNYEEVIHHYRKLDETHRAA